MLFEELENVRAVLSEAHSYRVFHRLVGVVSPELKNLIVAMRAHRKIHVDVILGLKCPRGCRRSLVLERQASLSMTRCSEGKAAGGAR